MFAALLDANLLVPVALADTLLRATEARRPPETAAAV